MKKICVLGLIAMFVLGGRPAVTVEAQGKGVSRLMAAKLKHSQKLLEGIAIGDFNKITSSAEELIQLSKTAEWFMVKTPRYEMHSLEFRRTAETLIEKARIKNLDGTTLAFFEMTMSCVRCHQYVREIRDARMRVEPIQRASLE